MAKSDKTAPEKKPGRIRQMREAYKVTKKGDPRIGWILLGTFVFAALVAFALLSLVPGSLVFDAVTGVMVGILATLIVFGRRATRSQVKQIEGQPGAAVAVLGMLKRGWRTDQAIAFNRQQDLVHRVVGPPGIVLIGEGNPNRLRSLLTAERVKHQRVAAEAPVHEVVVGYGEGEVQLGKLVRYVQKLPRELKPNEMTGVLARLKALDASRSNIPLPKGPVPTSMKGLRGNLRGR
jgi:MFS superfamily sulfate permease-like transporter